MGQQPVEPLAKAGRLWEGVVLRIRRHAQFDGDWLPLFDNLRVDSLTTPDRFQPQLVSHSRHNQIEDVAERVDVRQFHSLPIFR